MSNSMFRCLPTTRVAKFIEDYCAANYPKDRAISDFARDAGMHERAIYRIRAHEVPNISFELVDEILTNLGCLHMWHLQPEDGGFADYYYPDIPPAPVEADIRQARYAFTELVKRSARKKRVPWIDEMHARALEDDRIGVAA